MIAFTQRTDWKSSAAADESQADEGRLQDTKKLPLVMVELENCIAKPP